jgi:hypothetical protein
MPFTPFHFGPGAAIKGLIPRHFSFAVFCFANAVMDIEVLVLMARNADRWHGYCHTYLGAAVIGIVAIAVGWPVCQVCLRWWRSQPDVPLKEYYNPVPEIRATAAISGAFIGTFSHVFLDSVAHPDVRPLFPFNNENHLFGFIGAGAVYGICFLLGVIGAFLCARVRKADL